MLARRTRRPVVIGHGDGIVLFASTREALDAIARNAGMQLEIESSKDGTLVEIEDGREVARRRFSVDYRFPAASSSSTPPCRARSASCVPPLTRRSRRQPEPRRRSPADCRRPWSARPSPSACPHAAPRRRR